MALHDLEWFLSDEKAYDSLTVEQLHVLGNGGTVEYGDTVAEPAADSVVTPTDTPATETPASPDAATEDEPTLLAKDGKHTIPFSELETARTRLAEVEALNLEQAELIKNLQAAKVADAEVGGTANQDEVLAEFKEQYPEIATMLAPALQKMIDAAVSATRAEMKQELDAALAPIQKTAEDAAVDNHFETITEAIPDFEALRDSGKVDEWVKTLPSFARSGAERVLNEGTATEVIELFTQYKEAAGIKPDAPKTDTPSKAEIEAKAKEVIAKASGAKPTSLSDIPAAGVNVSGEEPTTVEGWSQKFAKMTPEQILAQM